MNWETSQKLQDGIFKTYQWINEQVKNQKYIFESPDGGKTIKKRVIN